MKVLEDQAHLLVGHRIWVQVHVAELGDDQVQDVRLPHLLDLEELEDAAHIGREALDVADEVLLDVVRIALEPFESERRMVVEALSGRLVQQLIQRVVPVLGAHLLVPAQDRCLGRGQDAVEPAQHGHG